MELEDRKGTRREAPRRKLSVRKWGPFKKGAQIPVAQGSHKDNKEQKGTRA